MSGEIMRIMYIQNTAGAMTPVAKWLVDNDHEVRILLTEKSDSFHVTTDLRFARKFDTSSELYTNVVTYLRCFKPDVIHVNSTIDGLLLARLLAPLTPIVFMYHGSEIRGKPIQDKEVELADRILVSTQDLSKYGEWFDRPISDIFVYKGSRKGDTAVLFHASYFMLDGRKLAKDWCNDRGIDLIICDRDKGDEVSHDRMPQFLSKFEYFLDFKGYQVCGTLSMTALEALLCGCKVVSDTDLETIITLDDYDVKSVVDYYQMYLELRKSFPLRAIRRLALLLILFVRRVVRKPYILESLILGLMKSCCRKI